MRTLLHILTRPEDELTQSLLAQQRSLSDTTIEIVRLDAPAPDYDALLEKIFTADSVEVS